MQRNENELLKKVYIDNKEKIELEHVFVGKMFGEFRVKCVTLKKTK